MRSFLRDFRTWEVAPVRPGGGGRDGGDYAEHAEKKRRLPLDRQDIMPSLERLVLCGASDLTDRSS
jgi:hypothetical protein